MFGKWILQPPTFPQELKSSPLTRGERRTNRSSGERIGLILFTGASWSPRKCLQYYKNWSRQQNQRDRIRMEAQWTWAYRARECFVGSHVLARHRNSRIIFMCSHRTPPNLRSHADGHEGIFTVTHGDHNWEQTDGGGLWLDIIKDLKV